MTRRHYNRVPAWLLVALVGLLLATMTGCERKVEGTVAVEDTVSDQCFNCHNGRLDAMQGEWNNSIHASGANVDYTSRPAPNNCQRCHNQDGFITWINTGTILATATNSKAIGCFACHNPHEFGDMRRRTEAPVTMVSGAVYNVGTGKSNLCANCHQSREAAAVITDPYTITSSRFGPHHGPQGDFLIASNGYTGFAGFTPTASLHRDVLADGCVTCHMGYANTHEGYEVGGHSWNMKDEAGNNLTANCKSSGCHDAGALAFTNSTDPVGKPYDFKLTTGAQDWDKDGAVEGYQTELEGMLDSLRTLLTVQNIYNPANGLAKTGTFPGPLAGSYWNYIMVEEDRSEGIHNWEYMRGLLQASIDYTAALPVP